MDIQAILLALAIALAVGKLAGFAFDRLGVPAVVGEILAGLLLANAPLVFPFFSPGKVLQSSEVLHGLSELGVILLLFQVGLESDLSTLVRVGFRASLVAVVGVLAPFLLTLIFWKFGFFGFPVSWIGAVFIAATMTATSVGITARILSEAGVLRSKTGQIILNAAVIDDVLGLLILAVVTAIAAGNGSSLLGQVAGISVKALLFFLIIIPIGHFVLPFLIKMVSRAQILSVFGFCVCLVFSWFGMLFGLAPIVGAFFAGLLVDDPEDQVRTAIEPVVQILSPLFFVLVGAGVKVQALASVFQEGAFFSFTLSLFAAAIIGKLACGVVSGPKTDRWAVGMGMAPRGEVGLIFALTALQAGVFGQRLYAMVILVVLLTTLIPCVFLSRYLGSRRGKIL